MERYKAVLAYDGTRFFGFQRQADTRTVQGVVENALRELNWEGQSLLAAGRTDAGVHARGQVIAFDLDWDHPPEDLMHAINHYLPKDVAVQDLQGAGIDFHPRFDAVSRRYEYRLICSPVRDPLCERFAWRVWPPVYVQELHEPASALVGRHDFAAFGSPPHQDGSTERMVYDALWKEHQGTIIFEITANAFLYHMVRRIVQLQIDIAQGKFAPESGPDIVSKYLSGVIPPPVQGLAPPQGLFLANVNYQNDPL